MTKKLYQYFFWFLPPVSGSLDRLIYFGNQLEAISIFDGTTNIHTINLELYDDVPI
jgi:hypothetical protein